MTPPVSPAGPPVRPGLGGHTLAFLSLRLWLGARAILAGLEKYSATATRQEPMLDSTGMPDASGAMIEVESKVYGLAHYHAVPESLLTKLAAEPLLPGFLLKPFCAMLGPVLILTGALLLAGVASRLSLFAMGLLYTALTAGLILIGQDPGVSSLGVHLGLVALALVLADHNRFSVTKS